MDTSGISISQKTTWLHTNTLYKQQHDT